VKKNKKELLLVGEEILLADALSWKQVVNMHNKKAGETDVWDKDDVMMHWTKKCVINSNSQQVRPVLQMASSDTARKCSFKF
jgi:hypothetical protein